MLAAAASGRAASVGGAGRGAASSAMPPRGAAAAPRCLCAVLSLRRAVAAPCCRAAGAIGRLARLTAARYNHPRRFMHPTPGVFVMRFANLRVVAGGALVAVIGMASVATAEGPPEGFRPLFNGVDLAGWHGMDTFSLRKLAEMSPEERQQKLDQWNATIAPHWKAVDGILENDGHGAYLTTDAEFRDYELLVDYKTVPLADSGIYLKGTPQVQIWDWTEEAKFKIGADKGSGGLWNNSPGAAGKDPSARADKPFGEWNRFRILQLGARTTVTLNDQVVVDHAIMENYFDRSAPLFPQGPIQLQTHGGPISWRNVAIREIPADEANAHLRARSGDGFTPLFNGTDLTGWQGAVDSYEVVDGAIRCKAGHGGVLHTPEMYGDFVARLEFRLPAGGNNGLAIRYPGEGDTAYTGMCELQVLDSEHEKYAKLDPRQYHGSAYGMVAAHRGYLRPTGEWNFQIVTVKGSTITVELNGSVILNADLSKVTEFMGGRPHPGKDRTEGYFGFAGHSDPVEFRNVDIRRLAAE